jgi:hypothetical protein
MANSRKTAAATPTEIELPRNRVELEQLHKAVAGAIGLLERDQYRNESILARLRSQGEDSHNDQELMQFCNRVCEAADTDWAIEGASLRLAKEYVDRGKSQALDDILDTDQKLSLDATSEPLSAEAARRNWLARMNVQLDGQVLRLGLLRDLRARIVTALKQLSGSPNPNPNELQPTRPVVQLRGLTKKPIVNGVEVETLTEPYYRVIEGLIKAGVNGLDKTELEKIKGDARTYLRTLKNKSPAWDDAIVTAGKAWGRYSIRHA